jgi:hypothetical protein
MSVMLRLSDHNFVCISHLHHKLYLILSCRTLKLLVLTVQYEVKLNVRPTICRAATKEEQG